MLFLFHLAVDSCQLLDDESVDAKVEINNDMFAHAQEHPHFILILILDLEEIRSFSSVRLLRGRFCLG